MAPKYTTDSALVPLNTILPAPSSLCSRLINQEHVEGLAQDIHKEGFQANKSHLLVRKAFFSADDSVVPEGSNKEDFHILLDGSHRYAAFKSLEEEGKVEPAMDVPVTILKTAPGEELSAADCATADVHREGNCEDSFPEQVGGILA